MPRAFIPMLFVHIPKTAGTSFRNGVQRYLGPDRMVVDYGPKQSITSNLVRKWRYEDRQPAKLRHAFDVQGKKFLSGHIQLLDYVGYFDLYSVATFLRDPVQRVISEYHHFVRHYGFRESLEDFAQIPNFQNKQSKALGGIDIEQLGFVGIVEHYEDSLAILNQHFGWEVPSLVTNMGRKQLSENYKIPRQTRQLIEDHNHLDSILYRQASERIYRNDRTGETAAPEPASGACRLISKNLLRGWACCIASERPTLVRIYINGEQHAELYATQYRPEIQKKGIKRSGCAGFDLDLPELKSGDEVRCVDAHSGRNLSNSPLTVV